MENLVEKIETTIDVLLDLKEFILNGLADTSTKERAKSYGTNT